MAARSPRRVMVSALRSASALVSSVGFAVLALGGTAAADTVYVDATPLVDPKPPAGAVVFTTMQAAIDSTQVFDEIVVYPGTYTATGSSPVVNTKGRAVVLRALNPEPLTDAEVSFIDGQGARRGIMCISGESRSTKIIGFTIRNGSNNSGAGGIVSGSSPWIEDCRFQSNVAGSTGGGLQLANSQALLLDCVFKSNNAPGSGGGIAASECSLEIMDCRFEDNRSRFGGGAYFNSDDSRIDGCAFVGNLTNQEDARGAGLFGRDARLHVLDTEFSSNKTEVCPWPYPANFGGGVYIEGCSVQARFERCIWTSNRAGCNAYGGAIALNPCWNAGTISVVDCTFSSNYGDSGGAIWATARAEVEVVGSLFDGNDCLFNGGAVHLGGDYGSDAGFARFTGSTFVDNAVSADRGGAIFVGDPYIPVSIEECRFIGNTANTTGGALWFEMAWGPVQRTIRESVFLNNSAVSSGGPIFGSGGGKIRIGESHFCGNLPAPVVGNVFTTQPNCFAAVCNDSNPQDGIPDACNPQITDFDGLETEIRPILHAVTGLPTGAVTWRVFARFDDGGELATVTSIYGNAQNPLSVSAAGGFYQSPTGGDLVNFVECDPSDTSLLYDSFFTIAGECQLEAVVTTQGAFNFGGPGCSSSCFNSSSGPGGIATTNGAIYVYPDYEPSRAGPDLRVLLMQLTTKTPEKPTAAINLIGDNADPGASNEWFAYQLAIPEPVLVDCNENGIHDAVEIASATVRDCDLNGVPDACQSPDLANDCDSDGTPDACEIRLGTAVDVRGGGPNGDLPDGVPDNCQCEGDVDQNGVVNVDDLIEIFVAWGDPVRNPDTNGDADLDNNEVVDAQDLMIVIHNWGNCPGN